MWLAEKGGGGKLMSAALESATHAGRLPLRAFGAKSRAIASYARQGYVEAGARKFRVGANEYDDLVLARAL